MPLKNKPNNANNEELIDNNPNYGNKKRGTSSKSEHLQEKEYKLESIPGTKSLLFDFESRWEEVERKKIEVLNQIKQNNAFYALNNNKDMSSEHHKVKPNSARREKEPGASRPISNNSKNNNPNSNNNKNLHKETNQGSKGNVPNRYLEKYNRQHENLFDIKLRDKCQENLVTENNNFDNFIQRKEQEMNENVQKNQEKAFDSGNKQLKRNHSNKNIIQEGRQQGGNFSFLKNKSEIPANSRKEEGSSKHLNDNAADNTNNYNFNKIQNKFDNIYSIFNVIPKKENKEEVKNKYNKNFDFESIINQVEKQQLFKNKKTLINNIMSKNEERFNEDKFIYPVGGNKFKNKK